MAGRLPRVTGATGSVDTAGEGGFLGGTVFSTAGGAGVETMDTADEVAVYQFVLPFRAVVGRISFGVSTLEASTFAGFGIYDKDGNRLVHSGAVSVAATGVKSVTVTAVTLEPGIYFHAWTVDGTTAAINVSGDASNGTAADIQVQGSAAKIGKAANASSSGVLPATLGTVTGNTTLRLPIVYYEP